MEGLQLVWRSGTSEILWSIAHPLILSPPQIVTLALSTVLFVKYIFLDKSKTFESSAPPTPSTSPTPPLLTNPTPLSHTSSCPFKIDSQSSSKLVHQRHTTTTYTAELSCAAPSSLKASVPSAQYPVAPQAVDVSVGLSETGVKPLALTDGISQVRKRVTSVAIQTVPKENAMFSIARRSSSSSDSAVASSDEIEEKRELEDEQPQRSLEECLAIFRSDVSVISLVVFLLSVIGSGTMLKCLSF